ncbi:MAG: PKD domain-containing protein [Bacteroidetes bacterium]|nr:PKD domain-containing protein [Bacteroidota bacterium]
MKKNVLKLILLMLLSFSIKGFSQSIIYNETFTGGSGYSSGSSQWDNWTTLRTSLADTIANRYLSVTISGTNDATGRTCSDPTLTRRIASNLGNASNLTISCGGYNWVVGSCGSGPELNVTSTGAGICNCLSPGWTLRPQINAGNQNWGGVNTATCGGATQTIKLEFKRATKNNDAGVGAFSAISLCNTPQALTARVFNYGKFRLDSFRLHYTINGVLQPIRYVTCRIASTKDTTITVNTSLALTPNTNYQLKSWTSRPNGVLLDSIAANDTFLTPNVLFLGNPSPPTVSNTSQCGKGSAMLSCTPNTPSDSISWYDAATGGNLLGNGKNLTGPIISATTTFYAEAARYSSLSNTFSPSSGGNTIVNASTSSFNGGYFNITPINNINIDSFTIRLWQNVGTTLRLYSRIGTFVGNQTNANAWTLVNQGAATTFIKGGQVYAMISAKNMILNTGTTYGFYITVDPTSGGNDIFLTNGATNISNSDMTHIGGSVAGSLFASSGIISTWTMNLEVKYKKGCNNPTRVAQTITVKPRPIGASVIAGTPFQGRVRVGDPSIPDLIEVGKTASYQIVPPTGYSNGTYGSTWLINSVIGKTASNVLLVQNTDYVYTAPSGSTNGYITYIGQAALLDNNITFSFRFIDLGPFYCDSTIARTIRVVPTPKPNFEFTSPVCDGETVVFNNLTTVSSGSASHMWYFGDGDSSDLLNPFHLYRTFGTYNVRLVSTSFPYLIKKDTTIQLEVVEKPTAKFKVNNACKGVNVTFLNQSFIGSGALSYVWNFGDNSATSTLANPTKQYAVAGGYKVTLTVSASGCISTLTKNAYQFAKPVANFTAPSAPICASTPVVLPNTSSIILGVFGQKWSFGDATISTEFLGYKNYTIPNTYSVKLLAVSEFGCTDSIIKTVTIKPTPVPDFNYTRLCSGLPSSFTNTTLETVPNPGYTWIFSDGITANSKNTSRSWPAPTSYTATLKSVFSNGCEASITKNLNVTIQPKANFTVADICSGETANFVNLTAGDRGNIQTKWDFGNGTGTDYSPTRLYNPSITQTYGVQLVSSYINGCSDTIVKSLTVSQSPTCGFTSKNLGFLNYQFTPSNTSYTKYEWFYGEGGTVVATSPTYRYLYDGNFKVKMVATNSAGCKCDVTNTLSTNTSINSISTGNKLAIYPNPNNGMFTINSQASGMKVEVYNIIGEKVLTQNTTENTMNINLGDKAKGIYLVKVTVNGVTSTTKVTVAN